MSSPTRFPRSFSLFSGITVNHLSVFQQSVMKTPVGKGDAHNKTMGDKGSGLNVTVDVEVSCCLLFIQIMVALNLSSVKGFVVGLK